MAESEEEKESDDKEEDDSAFEEMSLGDKIESLCWNRRKERREHDYATAGWALCVMKEVMDDCAQHMVTGDDRDAIERVVTKFTVPCPNNKVNNMMMSDIVDQFWNEFDQFTSQTGWASNLARWNTPDARTGKSHLWHYKYSLPYTAMYLDMLLVACVRRFLALGRRSVFGVIQKQSRPVRGSISNRSPAQAGAVYPIW